LYERDAAAAGHRHEEHDAVLLRGRHRHRDAGLRRHPVAGQVPDARRGDRMTQLAAVPVWSAIAVTLLLLLGSSLTLIGSLGLLRLRSFYQRMHATTLGTSGGVPVIALGSMLLFATAGDRLVLHETVIVVFVIITTP